MNRQQVGIYLAFTRHLRDNVIDCTRLAQDQRASGQCVSHLGKLQAAPVCERSKLCQRAATPLALLSHDREPQ